MERKRDKNGRFVKKEQTAKKELTSKKYEEKIKCLERAIDLLELRVLSESALCEHWENMYKEKKILIGNAKNLLEVADMSIKWLLKRVPVWTRKKFQTYYKELMNSYDELKTVPEDMKKFQ